MKVLLCAIKSCSLSGNCHSAAVQTKQINNHLTAKLLKEISYEKKVYSTYFKNYV